MNAPDRLREFPGAAPRKKGAESRRSAAPGAFFRHDRFAVPLSDAEILRFYLDNLVVPHARTELAAITAVRRFRPLAKLWARRTRGLQTFADPGELLGNLSFELRTRGIDATPGSTIILGDHLRSRRAKRVLFMFHDGAGEPHAIVKVSDNPAHAAKIEREQQVLERLRTRLSPSLRSSLPSPLGAGRLDDTVFAAETFLPGRSMYVEMRNAWHPRRHVGKHFEAPMEWLRRFQQETRDGEFEPAEAISQVFYNLRRTVRLTAPEEACLARVELKANSLDGIRLPAVAVHGDFWARNIIFSPRGVGVIDWEECADRGSPFTDLLQFVVTYGQSYAWRTGRWADPIAAFRATFAPNTVLGRTVRRSLDLYCARTGLPTGMIDLGMAGFLAEKVLQDAHDKQSDPVSMRWRALLNEFARMPPCAFCG